MSVGRRSAYYFLSRSFLGPDLDVFGGGKSRFSKRGKSWRFKITAKEKKFGKLHINAVEKFAEEESVLKRSDYK